MPEYRVVVIDHDNHILSTVFNFICNNDQETHAKAEELEDTLHLELWQGTRKITRISARNRPNT